MNDLDRQIEYWSRVAEEKVFSHPFHPEKVLPLLPERPRILDFGCGYGRVVGELLDAGFEDVIGIDPSSGMIETGKTRDPRLDLRCTEDARLPFDDGTFDLVLLFAVLTCIPTDGGLRKTIAEARRVLRGSGVLYVSDYPLQADARNVERYERWREKYGVYGTFEVPDGGGRAALRDGTRHRVARRIRAGIARLRRGGDDEWESGADISGGGEEGVMEV